MKKLTATIITAVFLFSSCCYSYELPQISANSAIVMDTYSGRVLFSKNSNTRLPMASTTKIMTAIIALENSNLYDVIKVGKNSAYVEGSSIWLEEGETIIMEDALYGLMLNSGNDAAVAIAEHIGGNTESFAKLMNGTAKKIGALNTNFINPHGLDAKEHFTTAYDLALITYYGLKNPKFKEIVKTKEKKIPWQGHEWNRLLKNHNKLLWKYEYCDGVKTGFTKKSGRCLVSSATKDGWQIVAVTLNAGDDWNDHQKMLDYCFNTYKPQIIINKNQYIKTVMVNAGKKDRVSLIANDNIKIPIKEDELSKFTYQYNCPDYIEAPVTTNKPIGNIDILIDNEKIMSVPLYSSDYVEKQDILQSFNKTIKNWFMIFNSELYPAT